MHLLPKASCCSHPDGIDGSACESSDNESGGDSGTTAIDDNDDCDVGENDLMIHNASRSEIDEDAR